MEKKLIPSLQDSLLNESYRDLLKEYSECCIDNMLEDGLLKDVPIVSTICALAKFGSSIRERNLLKQTLNFINEFNQCGVSSDKIDQYRQKLQSNPKLSEKEIGRVLILLERQIDTIKSRFLARFFAAYINKDIDWDKFCELHDILERLFVSDIDKLNLAYENNGIDANQEIMYRHDRLLSIGLLKNQNRIGSNAFISTNGSESEKLMVVSEIGATFCDIVSPILNIHPYS